MQAPNSLEDGFPEGIAFSAMLDLSSLGDFFHFMVVIIIVINIIRITIIGVFVIILI